MKVMVNKSQFFEDLEDLAYYSGMNMGGTRSTMRGNFEEMDVTMEELKDLINKGYGIKINC
jgi:hypothetical protein